MEDPFAKRPAPFTTSYDNVVPRPSIDRVILSEKVLGSLGKSC